MAQVVVHVGGHDYRLACRDGEEAQLEKLGQYLDRKAEDLQQSLGQVTETRLLLMSAILVVDELLELRERQAQQEDADTEKASEAAPTPVEAEPVGADPEQVDAILAQTLEKITAVTAQLAQPAA
ncbi:MAG: cell division protein ZapA [Pseudomonadota bacterium]